MESALRGPVPSDLKVIETLGWHAVEGCRRLDLHLARAKGTCQKFGFPFDASMVRDALDQLDSDTDLRLRLTWSADGFELTYSEAAPVKGPWRVALHCTKLNSQDEWLSVKTTQRELYDTARAALPEGVDEWLFVNEQGQLCEGTITNIFLGTDSGLLTPSLSAGVLPGILRSELLETGQAKEADLVWEDLVAAEEIFVGNSLRGLISAELAL